MTLPDYHEARMPAEKEFAEVMEWLSERGLIGRSFGYDELADDRFVR